MTLRKTLLFLITTLSILQAQHPVPKNENAWLTFEGQNGPGKGKHIVLIAADQEYRSEQAMPMLARLLSTHHGFHTTVLFAVNKEGLVDPTLPVYPKKGEEAQFQKHNIPGLEHLAKADAVIFFHRLLSLPDDQLEHIVNFLDSGKPFTLLRTANHGFRGPLPYKGKKIHFGDIVGGAFRKHHGRWQADSTRGIIIPENKNHPILTGVTDIWGPTDVYRTYPEDGSLPEGCTPLVLGQPLVGRKKDDAPNTKKIPLPVVWTTHWETTTGKKSRILHSTMGSAKDLQSEGLRRLVVNSLYWGLKMEDQIKANSSVDIVGEYKPLSSGFSYEKIGVKPQKPTTYVK